MIYPPRPNNITISGVIAGNILENDDTSITVMDSGLDGTVVMRTENKIALVVNPGQKTSINTTKSDAMLTVNNNSSIVPTFRMSYQNNYFFDGSISATGRVTFIPNCVDLTLNPNLVTEFKKNLNIADHDGMGMGLRLGGTLITASATELNYVDVPKGIAAASKALILDASMDVEGINNLKASFLTGTILTGAQPNITSLLDVDITRNFKIHGELLDVDVPTLRLLNVSNKGTAYPLKALILDANKDITGVNTLTANVIRGTIGEGPQPNITRLSGLTSLTNNGPTSLNGNVTISSQTTHLTLFYHDIRISEIFTNSAGDMNLRASSGKVKLSTGNNLEISGHNGTTVGLILGSTLVTSSADQLNYNNVPVGAAYPNKSLVLDTNKTILGINQLSANTLIGTILTPSQPYISSVATLNITNHGESTGLSLNGTLITSTAAELNYVDVSPGTAVANKALVLDGSNNISGIGRLSASLLAGVLTSASQPNIKSVDTLTISNHNGSEGLRLGSTLVTASAAELNRVSVNPGFATDGKALVVDSALNIRGINILEASKVSGTIQTPIQPNITDVNTLNIATHNGSTTGLYLGGTLVSATAAELNRIDTTPGIAAINKAVVLDSSNSFKGINILSANTLTGLISEPTQQHIRNLMSINIVDHDGEATGLSLNGTLITSAAYQLNYTDVPQGIGEASRALILDSTRDIRNINSITANTFIGTVQTETQPYIKRVSVLNVIDHNGTNSGLSLNGTLITATASQLNRMTASAGAASSNKAMILNNDKSISGINLLSALSLEGIILTAEQPNIKSVETLDVTRHNGTIGLALGGTIVTASAEQLNQVDAIVGTASSNKALIVDNFRSIRNINELTAATITGSIQTGDQPGIVSVSTLNIQNHDGGSNGLRLGGVLVSASASQINYTTVFPGVASSLKALVTNEYNSISGINSLTATKITADKLSLTGIISNFNTGGVIIKTYSFTDIVGRIVDIQLLPSLSFSNFQPADLINGYSCELVGYIRPQYSQTYSFFVTCNDRVRMWINGELILHSWIGTSDARTSSTIFLNAEQWVPIYIQYQVDTGSSPLFLLEWSSSSVSRNTIPSNRLAWDNNQPASTNKHFSQNSLSIYNTSTAALNVAKFSVDTGGDLIIDASGNDVNLGNGDSLNIPAHDGSARGLYLGGVLVQPTAYELNYLKVSPGAATASHALVIDGSKSIDGINSIKATAISCDQLTTSAFTISNLSLSGPLNNYNVGSLLIRQITGSDVSGRIVNVDTITDINLTNYDPKELNSNFSLDIIGYLLPGFTESYKFYATANDRVRIWVANQLILNVWDTNSGLEYTSDPIQLTAGQYVPIYIQYQNITGSSAIQVRWSSTTLIKSFISSSYMAWDNSFITPIRTVNSADRLSLFSSVSGLTSVQTGSIAVDGTGVMSLSSKAGSVSVVASTNFNIIGHNGTYGLQLAGNLVTATAAEINYLSGSNPGSVEALKAIILDSSKSLSGLSSISSDNIIGTIRTPAQPYITSLGTLSSPLKSSSDIIITSTNVLRLSSDAAASYIQAGTSEISNAAADLFIGNYGVNIATSLRKFMIKASGFVGIQTSSPTKALSVNGAGSAYCMRLIHNASNGSESAFCDIGVDSSSTLKVSSNLTIGTTGTTTFAVDSTGNMKITPSGNSIQIGNTTNSIIPLEVGSGSFSLTAASGYLNSAGSTGLVVPTATSYSIRTTSSIIVNGALYVTSDRRLKEQIETLSYDECRRFIMAAKPVRFNYISDSDRSNHYGLIAQDVAKTNLASLVKASPYEGLQQEIDSDGYISPLDAAFNVSYEEIIPILITTAKETLTENALLKIQVSTLSSQLRSLESRMKEMEAIIRTLNNA